MDLRRTDLGSFSSIHRHVRAILLGQTLANIGECIFTRAQEFRASLAHTAFVVELVVKSIEKISRLIQERQTGNHLTDRCMDAWNDQDRRSEYVYFHLAHPRPSRYSIGNRVIWQRTCPDVSLEIDGHSPARDWRQENLCSIARVGRHLLPEWTSSLDERRGTDEENLMDRRRSDWPML